MNLFIIARKTTTCWVFDHEHQSTVNEALCNGTENVIDWYYEVVNKRSPEIGDQISFYLSTDKFDDAITKIELIETNQSGSIYIDDLSNMNLWLCPWLQGYFGEVPKKIYIDCKTVNTISEEELDSIMEHIYK